MATYGKNVISFFDSPHGEEFEHKHLTDGSVYTEAERSIPVVRKVDVLVIGGGPGGVASAIAAARGGADTLLLERYGHLGGMATGGLVNIIPNLADAYGDQWIAGICQELIDRIVARGAANYPPKDSWGKPDELVKKYLKSNMGHFYVRRNKNDEDVVLYTAVIDPEVAKDEIFKMVTEAGADVQLHTWVAEPIVEGNKVIGVMAETKSGRQAYLADVVIDSTGDGDLLRSVPTPIEEELIPQTRIAQFGWVYWMCNVNLEKYDEFIANEPEKYKEICETIKAEGGRPTFMRGLLDHQEGVVWCHNLVGSLNQVEPEEMTYIDSITRSKCVKSWELLKKYMPGFEKSFIMLSNPQLGTSGGRRIVGEYYLTAADLDRTEPFEDTIAIFADNDRGPVSLDYPKTYVPYRALVPKGVEGLLVACRAFSADPDFQEFFNLIPHCLCFGHAAGAAAAIAVKQGISVRDVPYCELKKVLLEGGAILP